MGSHALDTGRGRREIAYSESRGFCDRSYLAIPNLDTDDFNRLVQADCCEVGVCG